MAGCRRQEAQQQHQSARFTCSSFLCNETILESFLTAITYITAHQFPKPTSYNAQGNLADQLQKFVTATDNVSFSDPPASTSP
jgi:hypothetical protein